MATEAPPQINPNPTATGLPWWLTSKTFAGLLALVVAFALSKFRGSAVTPEDQAVVDLADSIIAVIGAVLAVAGRIHAERKIRAGLAGSAQPAALCARDHLCATEGAGPCNGFPRPGSVGPDASGAIRAGNGGFVTWPLLLALGLLGLMGLTLVFCSGCAAQRSAADRQFRDRVEAVSVGVTPAGGTFDVRFRKPDAKAVKPLGGDEGPQLDTLFHEGRVIVPGVGNFSEAEFASSKWPRVELRTADAATSEDAR